MNSNLNKNAVLLAQALIVVFILFAVSMPIFAAETGRVDNGIVPCGGQGQEQCDFNYLVVLGNKIINFLIYNLAPVVAVILFIWAGYLYMIKSASGGSVEEAKSMLWNTVVGFLIAIGAFLIIKFIVEGLGTTSDFKSLISF